MHSGTAHAPVVSRSTRCLSPCGVPSKREIGRHAGLLAGVARAAASSRV